MTANTFVRSVLTPFSSLRFTLTCWLLPFPFLLVNKETLKLNQLQHGELWQGVVTEDIIPKCHKIHPGPGFTCKGRKSGAAGRFLSCNTMLCTDSSQVPVHRAPWPHVTCSTFGTSALSLDYFPPGPLHSLTASVIFEIWGRALWDFAAAILGTDATRQIGQISAPSLLSSAGQGSYLTPPGKIRHDKRCWTMNWCLSIQTSVLRRASFDTRTESVNRNFLNICSQQATKCL